jgi:hypothetical protein
MTDWTPEDGITDPFELAKQKRWLDLARLGVDAWNTWAEEELKKPEEERARVILSGQEIDVSDFAGFVFPGNADFRSATFSGNAAFQGATFSGDADFERATFSGDAEFQGTNFENRADFAHAVFIQTLQTGSTFFAGHFFFNGTEFRYPPNFVSTSFKNPPVFLGTKFKYPAGLWPFGICKISDGEARYRRLKQLATESHDHEMELDLFAFETKAKRSHSQKLFSPTGPARLLASYIYELASDFGRSWIRPLVGLLATVAVAFTQFRAVAPAGTSDWVSFVAAGINIFPFAGQAVTGRKIMVEGLCPTPDADTESALDCLTQLYTISAVEGFFGLIFLFLIGLGLRNRFRIK